MSLQAQHPRMALGRYNNGNIHCICTHRETCKKDVAMTGEVTLRGRVLPIGGLKEKALAAKRMGIKVVIVPKEIKRPRRYSQVC